MVIGMVTVNSCHGKADIPVELVDKGPRPGTIWVRALDGLQPFTKISHGGPYQDDTIVIPLPFVWDIHLEKEVGQQSEPFLAPDWFLESAYEDRTGGE